MTTVYITIGAPASGKSTHARERFESHEIVSSDHARYLISGSESNQFVTRQAWDIVHAIVKAKLRSRQENVCIDSTAAKRRDRSNLIHFIRSHMPEDTKIVGLFFAPTYEVLYERNENRERRVPVDVIKNMMHAIKSAPPSLSEGFDEIVEVVNDLKIKIGP